MHFKSSLPLPATDMHLGFGGVWVDMFIILAERKAIEFNNEDIPYHQTCICK
jgi:hypothetical protein